MNFVSKRLCIFYPQFLYQYSQIRLSVRAAIDPTGLIKTPQVVLFYCCFYFIVGTEPGALGASRYKGSTAGIKALSCSMRVSPEGWVDKNSGGFFP
jgi:hypothetical protein